MAAGVSSVNVVGYINASVPPGFSFIANQLVGASSKLSDLIPTPPSGTVLYSWDGGFVANPFDQLGDSTWANGDLTLTPGGGALIFNPDNIKPFTVTFVGEVKQGTLTTAIPKGFSFVSSQVPQEGDIDALSYVAKNGDVVYLWDGGFVAYPYNQLGDDTWGAGAPHLTVGSSALIFSTDGGSWTRSFTVL